MSIHTRKGKITNTDPGTHMMQQRFEPIRAEFVTRLQTAVGERVEPSDTHLQQRIGKYIQHFAKYSMHFE